jgi:hypothetical protein
VGARFCLEVGLEEKGLQGIHLRIHLKDHVASSATVSAIWPSLGHELFSAEAGAAIATIPGFGVDAKVVDEHGRSNCPQLRRLPAAIVRFPVTGALAGRLQQYL